MRSRMLFTSLRTCFRI